MVYDFSPDTSRVRLWHRLLRRSASEYGRLRHVDGAHGRCVRPRWPTSMRPPKVTACRAFVS